MEDTISQENLADRIFDLVARGRHPLTKARNILNDQHPEIKLTLTKTRTLYAQAETRYVQLYVGAISSRIAQEVEQLTRVEEKLWIQWEKTTRDGVIRRTEKWRWQVDKETDKRKRVMTGEDITYSPNAGSEIMTMILEVLDRRHALLSIGGKQSIEYIQNKLQLNNSNGGQIALVGMNPQEMWQKDDGGGDDVTIIDG